MRSIRWLFLLCGILCLQDTALADSCTVAATQGPYSLNLCLSPSLVIENGPLGSETFPIFNHLIIWEDFFSLALNDRGQWALVTGGGTSDPSTMYGQYTGAITVPPILLVNAFGCNPSGVQPGGILSADDGGLGYDISKSLGFPIDCTSIPKITGITDQGQVSATVNYRLFTNQGDVFGSIDYTWNFVSPVSVPEPGSLPLVIGGLLFAVAFSLRAEYSSRLPLRD